MRACPGLRWGKGRDVSSGGSRVVGQANRGGAGTGAIARSLISASGKGRNHRVVQVQTASRRGACAAVLVVRAEAPPAPPFSV